MSTTDMAVRQATEHRRNRDIAGAADILGPLVQRVSYAPAWHAWGLTLAAMGDEAGAIHALRHALRLDPSNSDAWRDIADILILMGDAAAAGQAYANASRAGLRDASLMPAAQALCEGRHDEVERLLKPRLRAAPDDQPALGLLASAAMRVGRIDEAQGLLDRLMQLAPDPTGARRGLALMYYALGKYAHAVPHLTWLIGRTPDNASLRKLLVACLARHGDDTRAIPHYQYLLESFRNQPKMWLLYGHSLRAIGRDADAVRAYRTCIGIVPQAAVAYLALADIRTAGFADTDMAAMRAQLARPAINAEDKAQLQYALGGALEQRGDFENSFAAYQAGAALRRAHIKYDADVASDAMARTAAVFDTAFFARRRGAGSGNEAPIFVLGLARSGSTLVEQILASHSAVEGTMELTEIGAIAAELQERATQARMSYGAFVGTLDGGALTQLGEQFLARTSGFRRLGRRFFIDKMPPNFRHIGLIQLILPQAKIIDVRRRAMAAGFALFKQYFQATQESQDYTYDLTEIGRYYCDYVMLMAHFDAVLPGRIYRVRYEDLVTDTARQVGALLDHCGLLLEPACLEFWETRRSVQTPSAQQVRRPIFRDGLHQWRRYEPWLGPLRAALGPLADR